MVKMLEISKYMHTLYRTVKEQQNFRTTNIVSNLETVMNFFYQNFIILVTVVRTSYARLIGRYKTSMMKFLCENSRRLKNMKTFTKKLRRRRLIVS